MKPVMKQLQDFRLRILGPQGNVTYLTRRNGKVSYFGASETPLALSNLLHDKAAETRFAMEDARDGSAACSTLERVLNAIWKNNMPLCPIVELL